MLHIPLKKNKHIHSFVSAHWLNEVCEAQCSSHYFECHHLMQINPLRYKLFYVITAQIWKMIHTYSKLQRTRLQNCNWCGPEDITLTASVHLCALPLWMRTGQNINITKCNYKIPWYLKRSVLLFFCCCWNHWWDSGSFSWGAAMKRSATVFNAVSFQTPHSEE